ncbi:Hsp20/alpha crystallin family [Acididesulfobacillus acetoxydans]|uniref:Heat shock hsp20 proteins family profile n=1 Tax=Acididesulfobacillus acetoxydans TaxID=1561005 RepID=A0A8S0WZT9_9FIRM|nr:Hsp20/alpha crystallin family protein [Acididesulfobacillus acetoxydans]CAA7602161.1 Hsp20/alpha crystallin family [Acididesulfobacillus acetoxydans]CEJ08717.1 Heat shock hsp20 proteins family profile [Acididesulfobacillus acetoxydans]
MFGLTPYRRGAIQVPENLLPVESLFANFFSDPFFSSIPWGMSGMKVDIKDTEKAYVLEADIPGIKKEDLRLEFDNGCLSIAVERAEDTKSEQDKYLRQERRFTSAARTFAFDDVEPEQISAHYENGVLRVTLPKKDVSAKAQQIQIS